MADVNEAMKRAVEDRRRELQLEVGDLVKRSGLTRQGLGNVRKGLERDYHESTIFGIARALQWRTDWYDRILAGDEPINVDPTPTPPARDDIALLISELRAAVAGAEQRDQATNAVAKTVAQAAQQLTKVMNQVRANTEKLDRIAEFVEWREAALQRDEDSR